MIEPLQETLADVSKGRARARRELIDSVRCLIKRIEIVPLTQDRGGPIDLVLRNSGLLPYPNRTTRELWVGRGGVVAGGGIEPPTCGL